MGIFARKKKRNKKKREAPKSGASKAESFICYYKDGTPDFELILERGLRIKGVTYGESMHPTNVLFLCSNKAITIQYNNMYKCFYIKIDKRIESPTGDLTYVNVKRFKRSEIYVSNMKDWAS